MRKIIVSEFVSLDGIMESPHEWSFPFWNEEAAKYKFDELFASDALLLGRVTYQGFAAAWPSMTDEEGFADRMNNLPKFVVSATLQHADWNNSSLIKEDIVEEIKKIKRQAGRDILVFGSAMLVQTLMQHNLIDQYRIMVFPIVLGGGKGLFKNVNKTDLKLSEIKAFNSGVAVLHYHPS
jgi:dihydrofolate reductase